MTQTSSAAMATLVAEAEAHWQKRDDQKSLEMAIEGWEKIAAADPKNSDVMTSLARAYYFLVDGHIGIAESKTDDEQRALYQKGVDWGEKALLTLDPNFGKAMAAGGDFEVEIKKIPKEGMAAAYWYCTNLSRFAVKTGLSARLFYKDRVAAAMGRINELDPTFFFYASDRFFGAYYSAIPAIAGKDVDKSAAHFVIALDKAPEYLLNQVVKAEFLATEIDDEDMFKSLLEAVLAAPDHDELGVGPENRGAKRAATKMLGKIEEIF